MRYKSVVLLAIALSILVPCSQLVSAPSVAAATSSAHASKVKPNVFPATTVKRGGRASGPGTAPSRAAKKEVLSDRSRNSRTYVHGGDFETLIYPGSINFQDAKGRWQPIDDTLVAASDPTYAVQNKANSYTAFFPKSSTGAIHFVGEAGSIDFSLLGGQGTLSTKGNSATYANALPGVSLSYASNADALKESIRLDSAAAPTTFSFRLRTGPGLTARQGLGGTIVFVGHAGKTQYAFAPPYMSDSAGTESRNIRMSLGQDAGGELVTVTADPTWLKSAGRQFPVTIDPTIWANVNYYGGQDCFIQNTNPTTNFCSSAAYTGTADQVGYDGSSVNRTLLSFPVQTGYTHIVPNSNIIDAELDLTLASSTSASAVAVTANPITDAWNDNYTTWNNRDNAVAWTTAGGDFGAALDAENIGPAAGSYHWVHLTQTIQNWVNGSGTNYGFLLKVSNEGAAGLLRFDNQAFDPSNSTDPNLPHLRIQWNNWNGLEPWYKFESHKLSDRMSLAVNVANGNLVVHATDLAIKGTGLDLHVDRYYNSLADNVDGGWHMGNGWNPSVGCDVRLDVDDFDGLTLHMPDGYAVLFRSNGNGSWTAPPGLDATLTQTNGTYTVAWHKNGEKFDFQSGGCLQDMKDQNGNTITMSYNGSVASITDTQNRVTTFTYNSPVNSDYISQISDPAGRTFNYAYNTNGDLTSYVDPNNKTTQYAYNANDQLSQIIDPNGSTINFTYGTTYPYQVSQIGYVNPSCSGGSCNTSFTYNAGRGSCDASVTFNGQTDNVYTNTVVTDANSHQTTYCLDNQGRAIQVLDAKGQKQSSSYTSDNNVQNYADAANPSNPTSFAYDPTTNNLTNAAEPMGANQTWGYKDCQNDPNSCNTAPAYYPDTYKDAQGNRYVYGYDSSNNLTSASNNGTGASWTATYNSNGTVKNNKDANGNVTSYAYDSAGNLTQITYPAPLGAVSMTYDTLSRMLTRTDGLGQKQTYAYDALDRVSQITYQANGSIPILPTDPTITYSYDNDGNTTQLQETSGTSTMLTRYTYDTMNRQLTKVLNDGTTMTYGYDGVGNLTSLQDPGGSVSYGYDQVNEVTSLTEPNGGRTSFGYNASYRRTSTAYPNGVTECMLYDKSERLTQIAALKPGQACPTTAGSPSTATMLDYFNYCYNSLNPCSTQTSADTDLRWSVSDLNSNRTAYSYDPLSRLTGASGAQSYTYGYDNNGNLTNDNGVTQKFNGANELCWSYAGSSSNACASPPTGSTTYTFDANGNETGNSAGMSFSYDPKSHTTSVTPPGGQALTMTYSGATQTERITAGSTSFTYNVLGCGGASTGTSGNTAYTRDNKGQLLEERLPGTPNYVPYYYLFDGLGSVVGLTDSSGSLQNTYTYGPYGEKRSWTEPVSNPWHFAGGYLDASTGLYKFGMRYYDPKVARWSQQDSRASSNLFEYGGDNPVNNVDPSGADFGEYVKQCAIGVGLAAIPAIATSETVIGSLVSLGLGCAGGLLGEYLKENSSAGAFLLPGLDAAGAYGSLWDLFTTWFELMPK